MEECLFYIIIFIYINKIANKQLVEKYKEMLNKKDHCYDVVTKLEKSIKEAQKMYQRKIKDIK